MTRRNIPYLVLALVLNFLLMGISAWGQTITSTIVGQVTDPSGGALPAAQVTVTNTETGIATQGSTGSSGAYSIPQLQPGLYDVSISKTGFQTSMATNIRVLSSQTMRVNMQLKVGAVHQVVSVTGAAPLIHTDTQTITDSIPTQVIDALPKSTQSIDTLIQLVPGVATSGSSAMISGSNYWGGDSWSLNGVSVEDPGNASAEYSYGLGMVNLPSTNSLQEFKVDSGGTNAEFRNTAGITMVLKQGTNQFHGEAYGYFENRELNANLFQNNAHGLPRTAYDRDQYGGLLGGPIKKDKLFFFGDYFHLRQVTPTAVSLLFPSIAMRQGDFSALCTTFTNGLCTNGTQLFNPQTGQPYSGNVIDPGTFSPIATKLASYMPPPNVATNAIALPGGGPNYQAAKTSRLIVNNTDERVDWQISKADSLSAFFRYSKGSPWFLASGASPANYGNFGDFGYTDYALSGTETHSFGATAINEFRLAWVDHASVRQGQNFNLKPWTIDPAIPVQNTGGLPTVSLSGYTGINDWGAGIPFPAYDVEISDNFTRILGRHTFKMGALESGYKFSIPGSDGHLSTPLGSYNGSFSSNGSWTGGKGWPGVAASAGNAFADFLLGDLSGTNYATVQNSIELFSREWDWYAQDSWQATSRLTINYGIRWMYQQQWHERNNRVSYLDATSGKLILPQNSGSVSAPPAQWAFANLLSAYPFETTQQAGLPLSYYRPDKNNWQPRFGFAWRPFQGNKTVIRGGYGVFYNFIPSEIGTLDATFNPPWRAGPTFSSLLPGTPTSPYLPDLTLANPFPAASAKAPPSSPLVYDSPRNLVNPVVQQWSLTLEQQFGHQWMGRISYVGAQTHHDLWYAFDINRPGVQQPNVPLQDQRPIQPWSNIYYNGTGGKSNFNQLQLEAMRRFSHGLNLQFEFDYNRSLDDVPVAGNLQNPDCFNCDYGNSDYIPDKRLVFNYVYQLPFGQGRHWMNRKGVADAVLGGWEVAGITTYTSGTPFSPAINVPSSVIGWWGGRPDRVSGASLYAGQNGSSHDIISGVPWFNPSAFAPPQKWTYGDAARNSMFGPGYENWDMSLMKTLTLKEHLHLQFRTDWFDAFNHFNLGNPSATIADTRDGGIPIPTAGKIYGGSGSRIIQLALRLMF